jgi:hypothetical protein
LTVHSLCSNFTFRRTLKTLMQLIRIVFMQNVHYDVIDVVAVVVVFVDVVVVVVFVDVVAVYKAALAA